MTDISSKYDKLTNGRTENWYHTWVGKAIPRIMDKMVPTLL